MRPLYAAWMDNWERRLADRDTNRVVRPFEWGLDWLDGCGRNGHPASELADYVASALADTDRFFDHRGSVPFRLQERRLSFPSALTTAYEENNRVHATYFHAAGHRGRAVLVLPQWNADASSHHGLCRLLNVFGLSALRMSLPYHDERKPAHLKRADYNVSSNLGRTIHATRQAVLDARRSLDWLQSQGYERLGILGTSLGSCVAFLAAAHESRLRAAVFNHVSMYFSDVVWSGLSCRHIRPSIEAQVSRDQLRAWWSVISPATYLDRLHGRALESLLVWGRHDSTFLPEYSRQVVEEFQARGYAHEVLEMPCGHYTSGRFPFNWWDGLRMCGFLRRKL